MTLAAITRRIGRLPAIARDGWNYPSHRLQAKPQSAPETLARLGLEVNDGDALVREFDHVAAALYPRLAALARAAGALEAEQRVRHPSPSSREAKKLLYLSVRLLAPELVVETGPFNGAASTFLLSALQRNASGRLLSFDVPDAQDALGVPLPAGLDPGWIVPAELRPQFEVVLGDIRQTLSPRLAVEGPIGLFVHDSLHTFGHMLFEYGTAWRFLRPGGVLISDDVGWNPAFWLFTKRHRTRFGHVGAVGVTRKPR